MGERAVFRIYSDDHAGAFYAQWATPQFKLSALARWIEACRWRGQAPSAQNYWDHAQADPTGDHFTESYPVDDLDPGDLSYRYELRSITTGEGWTAELTVWGRGRQATRGGFDEIRRIHIGSELTAPIHQFACEGLTELADNTDPNGPWADALPSWRHQAATHANYATFNPYLTAHNG
ncbi:hypothetical protein E0H75_42150 [Kribbella capetownensis]|uniref:Uncharacterized protein n=1 Tax=Kribbella capetownensis TaxID=1572659 RepID=A0A4R0IYF0_9ACTN|nr:hypothetical protein [Kribbella capetownensis]TCC33865.1 hypothetical protein E0H75_42150 [Kribbella capetownensis]